MMGAVGSLNFRAMYPIRPKISIMYTSEIRLLMEKEPMVDRTTITGIRIASETFVILMTCRQISMPMIPIIRFAAMKPMMIV